jgi:hypothetical protein
VKSLNFSFCVRTGRTAGPSTPLRSGRDDKFTVEALPRHLLSLKNATLNLSSRPEQSWACSPPTVMKLSVLTDLSSRPKRSVVERSAVSRLRRCFSTKCGGVATPAQQLLSIKNVPPNLSSQPERSGVEGPAVQPVVSRGFYEENG